MAKRRRKRKVRETRESLVEEYCAIAQHRKENSLRLPKGVTQQRFLYLRERILQVLESTEDFVWAAEKFAAAHGSWQPYEHLVRTAARRHLTIDQLNRLFPLVAKSKKELRALLIEKAVTEAKTKDELAIFLRYCFK